MRADGRDDGGTLKRNDFQHSERMVASQGFEDGGELTVADLRASSVGYSWSRLVYFDLVLGIR